ncbi:MAG: GAF domain-containing protein [Coriobacteriia bacterium]|nr:GAF domain-containing protein [Coriobacteriia bacterium]
MEVVRPHDENDVGASVPDAGSWRDTTAADVLESLVDLVAEGPLSDELPARAVDRVVALLDLSGATLSLVFEREGTLQLEPVASVGAHAAFARDMSARPLETLADVATAVSEGTPVFVVDSHGPASPASGTGVSRWRSSISAHATGVLPVRAWGETLGVLTVEWPGSRPLEDRERRLLESVAGILGVMLSRLDLKALHVDDAGTDTAEPATETSAFYGVTADGIVVPLSEGAAEGVAAALTVSVVTRAPTSDEVPVWDLAPSGRRSLACIVGTAAAGSGAAQSVAERAIATLHSYASQGVPPAEALTYLGHALRARSAADARVSALASEVELGGAAIQMSFSAAGAVLSAFQPHGGRFTMGLTDRPALGSASVQASAEQHLLLLPGDRVVFASGQVAALDTAEGWAKVRRALDDAPGDAVEAARTILAEIGEGTRAAMVAIITIPQSPVES